MRSDQITTLVTLQEQLIDVFAGEAKTDAWPEMSTQQGRGDRVWHKKNAFATLQIAGKIQSILVTEAQLRNMQPRDDGEADLDEENEIDAREAERQARTVLKKYGLKV